jgi:hypothetical protein
MRNNMVRIILKIFTQITEDEFVPFYETILVESKELEEKLNRSFLVVGAEIQNEIDRLKHIMK